MPKRKLSCYFLLDCQLRLTQLAELRGMHPDVIRRMVDNISFIAEHFRAQQAEDKVAKTLL